MNDDPATRMESTVREMVSFAPMPWQDIALAPYEVSARVRGWIDWAYAWHVDEVVHRDFVGFEPGDPWMIYDEPRGMMIMQTYFILIRLEGMGVPVPEMYRAASLIRHWMRHQG